MNIDSYTTLSSCQTDEINTLHSLCREKDGLRAEVFLSSELNYDRSLPVFFLGRENEMLTSFLTLFIPTPQEAEVTAFTSPLYRRQGQFSSLLEKACEVCRKNGIPRLLFAVEGSSESGQAVLKSLGRTAYEFTEYSMELCSLPESSMATDLEILPVCEENAALYRSLAVTALGRDLDTNSSYTKATLENPLRHGFIAMRDGEGIGLCHINYEDDLCVLYGLGLNKSERGKGYGEAFVRKVLQAVPQERMPVSLDVNSENIAALSLYKKLGFSETFRIDYYSYSL